MKIVTWNCNMAFRNKYKEISEFDADIYVICECEDPDNTESKKYKEFASNSYWIGDGHGSSFARRRFGKERSLQWPLKKINFRHN